MSNKTSAELAQEKAKLIAEAETLQTKSRSEQLSTEDDARLEDLIAQAEALDAEITKAVRDERLAEQKTRMEQPIRSAPTVPATYRTNEKVSFDEGLRLWLGANSKDGDRSPNAQYRARMAGFDLGSSVVSIPVDYSRLSYDRRRTLSTGGVGTGAELIYNTYSNLVTEYLTYFSPVLGLVNSETTSDGNKRTYFTIDDTALESAFITNGGGTELNPTIADVDLATAQQVIDVFDITSGLHKVTFQELRDSYVNLPEKIAKAIANAHARKMEREIVSGSGNGESGVEGIINACTANTYDSSSNTWTEAAIEDLYFTVPTQYRQECVFMSNAETFKDIRAALLADTDGVDRFGSFVQDGIEWNTLKGKKYIVSEFCDADTLYFFNPKFYMLRLVAGQQLKQFDERYWPHVGWAGMMSFGGAYLGPATAAQSLTMY